MHAKKVREDEELSNIESWINSKMKGDGLGFLSVGDKEELVQHEKRRRDLLTNREEAWTLKSRALCLRCGDENTKFF